MNPFPLFYDRLLRQQMAGFAFPGNLIPRFEYWRELGEAPDTPEFWQGLFEHVLGYDETTWGWEPTPHVGHLADIALGETPPVVGPPWAIAVSAEKIVLYRRDRGWAMHWAMPLAALTTFENLQALYFVLGRRTFLPMREGLSSRVEQLLTASESGWQEHLRGLARGWRQLQTQLVRDFRHRLRQETNSESQAMAAARTLMYRALWIGWAEAWGFCRPGLAGGGLPFRKPLSAATGVGKFPGGVSVVGARASPGTPPPRAPGAAVVCLGRSPRWAIVFGGRTVPPGLRIDPKPLSGRHPAGGDRGPLERKPTPLPHQGPARS
ncbi:MAG: hypothetical protein HC918_07745 [Oscillatoriales cyanobacterium SM2_1_8]|nr:hypothetical protein [Oscillatoriales cyanobacterium SM2_1_8]